MDKSFKITHVLLLFSIISITQISSKIKPDQVEIAINCGGPEYINGDGVVYKQDNYYDNGISSDYGLNYDIRSTNEMDVYQTERWHSDSFTYSIPLKKNGKYVLILKFSEVYFDAPGQKVFDVALGKKILIKNLDIFEKAGKAVAHDEYIEFELKDDKIYVKKAEIDGAYDAKTKNLKIRFLKGAQDNPKINSIMIFKGDLNDSSLADKRTKLEKINKSKLLESEKEMLTKLKHHPDYVYDEDAALNGDANLLFKENTSIWNFFFTLQGAYIVVSLVVLLLLNYILDFFDTGDRIVNRRIKVSKIE